MNIPESFKAKVVRIFGAKGKVWLENLPQILETCIEKWNLSNCRPCTQMSMNFICFGESPDFGEVALKVGVPYSDLFCEMKALSLYNGRNICKCYDYDVELGAMVLERVSPGVQLKALSDSEDRINFGSDVIAGLPLQLEDATELPAYSQWVEKAFKRAREENKVGEKMLYYINEAESLFKEIEVCDKRKVLLHGDLHHENILQDNNGQWKAIDPKGVIGPLSMEAARFIQNELSFVALEERLSSFGRMTEVFSEKLETSKRIIAACTFVLMVLSICWCFEDFTQSEEVYEDIKECGIYLNYLREITNEGVK